MEKAESHSHVQGAEAAPKKEGLLGRVKMSRAKARSGMGGDK